MSNVLAILVYLGAFQYTVAFWVVALVGPKSWSFFRSIVATLLWPLFLIAFMVQVPVKAIRRRHMSSDQAIAIVEDYIDRHGSGAATQERARGLREIAERTSSIAFWRGVLTDANATESEKIVAGQLLAQYFEVPKVAEIPEERRPKVIVPASRVYFIGDQEVSEEEWAALAAAHGKKGASVLFLTEAQRRERALQKAAELFSDEAQEALLTGLVRHLPPDQDYVSQQKPPTEVAIPSAYPRLPQTCLKCLGTGCELGPDGRRTWMTCSGCAGDGYFDLEDLRNKPYADRLCDHCGEIFRFNRNMPHHPTTCHECRADAGQARVMTWEDMMKAISIPDKDISE